jgi:rhodanese-related sulfurtransferase
MPKKTARTRRVKSPKLSPVADSVSFEKIDLIIEKEEQQIEEEIEDITKKFKKLLSDHSSLTKAEFIKFFVIPFLISFIILFASLLAFAAKDPIHVPSLKVKTSIHGVGDILSTLSKLGNHATSLKGQEVFDPYQVKLDLDKGNMFYTLIDIRSPQEFVRGHIRDAINLPAYNSFSDVKNLSLSENTIVKNLRATMPHKKPIVIYGTTRDSQITHDISAILSRNGYEVSTLGVGWNEWRHFTNLWVPEAGWESFQIENYVDEK